MKSVPNCIMKPDLENQKSNYQLITKTGVPNCITGTHSVWYTYYNDTPRFHGMKSSCPNCTDFGWTTPLATSIT
jgi:hypothetical protein